MLLKRKINLGHSLGYQVSSCTLWWYSLCRGWLLYETCRQAKGRSKVERYDVEGEGRTKSRDIPAPDANAESVLSMEKKAGQFNFRNEKFNPRQEESTFGFPIKAPRPRDGDEVISGRERTLHQNTSHSGPLVQRVARDEVGKNMNNAPTIPTTSGSSRRSILRNERCSTDVQICSIN